MLSILLLFVYLYTTTDKNYIKFTKLIFHYLETVAGEAARRSDTSNIMVCVGNNFIISPDVRQSFLLSSRTVFKFSIHIASTGPSKIYQRLSQSAVAISARIKVGNIPSVLQIGRAVHSKYSEFCVCFKYYLTLSML